MRKKIISKIVAAVQFIIIYPSLLLLYLFGFGITALLAHILNPSLVRAKKKNDKSFWIKKKEQESLIKDF